MVLKGRLDFEAIRLYNRVNQNALNGTNNLFNFSPLPVLQLLNLLEIHVLLPDHHFELLFQIFNFSLFLLQKLHQFIVKMVQSLGGLGPLAALLWGALGALLGRRVS